MRNPRRRTNPRDSPRRTGKAARPATGSLLRTVARPSRHDRATGPCLSSLEQELGSSTFHPDGDRLYVNGLSADDRSAHGKIQHRVRADAGCDGCTWQDLRTGCYGTTSIGDDGNEIRRS
ncbi:hypothetical protein GCM10018781_62700 [Kitasatospora indigofera]|uniref:Uncharacterized protein n=1 Tax=Kitasatospora indigofera TaxID=67307 RepID=A0A919GA56_9ACTN|nr:hypothetical protein [Kitasatospora indigofera]GHH81022.1 hypothetical protein GCM10018781_62700 [Kitasatospora indigofera]